MHPPAVQETAAWHLEGAVDIDALEQALSAVAQRHELLTSRFWRKNGKLMQSIDGEAPKFELKPLSKSKGAVQSIVLVSKSASHVGRLLATFGIKWEFGCAKAPNTVKSSGHAGSV